MASLLERIDISPVEGNSGPVRNRGGRASSAPYSRPHKLGQSKADADAVWKHDLYNGPGKDLVSRLADGPAISSRSGAAPKVNASGAAAALREAVGLAASRSALNIKGASSAGSNVLQVSGLVAGTTAADVEAIFKRCGSILEANVAGTEDVDSVTVRLKFKNSEDARSAVTKFDGQSADGRTLRVTVVGSASASLGGRLGGVVNGSVDALMDEDPDTSGGSKMRSDELLGDPRAVVLTAPLGTQPERDTWQRGRGSRGRGGHRGRRGRGARRGGAGMDID